MLSSKPSNTSVPPRSVAPTIAGALLLLVAIIYAVLLINAVVEGRSPSIAAFLSFFLVVPFAYTGAATIWRWKCWRAVTSALCWLMILTFAAGAFASVVGGPPQALIMPLLVLGFIVFVLWAVHREKKFDGATRVPRKIV